MWVPFEPNMLNEHEEIVINCKTEESERLVANLLDEAGITYPDGVSVLSKQCWRHSGFYYRVVRGKARRGTDVKGASFGSMCLLTYIDDELERTEISDDRFESVICAVG